MEMQEVEGFRKGATLYLYNNYLYRRDRVAKGINNYRCRQELCTARARHRIGDETVFLSSIHNHGAEDIGVLRLKSALKRAAYETDDRKSITGVFVNVVKNREARDRISHAEVEKCMYDAKRKKVLPCPTAVEDAAELLEPKLEGKALVSIFTDGSRADD